MKRNRNATRLLIQKIYDNVHAAARAILIAFVLWFLVVVVPKMPEIHAQADVLRDNEIAAEQHLYCGKLGMAPRTAMYYQCISYLAEYRAKIQQRIADETNPVF